MQVWTLTRTIDYESYRELMGVWRDIPTKTELVVLDVPDKLARELIKEAEDTQGLVEAEIRDVQYTLEPHTFED